jgi:hypothetical protein
MPQLIRPQEVKIVTKDGEVQVSIILDLNINLNSSGLQVTAQGRVAEEQEKPKEDPHWAIPDFGSSTKINFGKKE